MQMYCDQCGNLLDINILQNGELNLICTNDLIVYDAKPEDTLIETDNCLSEDSMSKFEKFINLSAFDVTNKKIMEACPKCGNMPSTLIRITDNEKVIKTCKCGNIW